MRERLRDNQTYFDTLDSMESLRLDFIRAYMPFEEREGDSVRITSADIETLRQRRIS